MRVEHSFIPVEGVGQQTERNLWRQGVTHWDAFDPGLVGSTLGDRIESFIDIAQDHLNRNDVRFFHEMFPSGSHWRLYETFQEQACHLDIETTGLDFDRDDVTVITLYQSGDTTTLVQDEDLTRHRLASELDRAGLLVTYNGKQFDIPFLKQEFGLSIKTPHLDLRYPCEQAELTGGLKTVEKEIGLERDEPDISGEDAVRLWHEYRRGDQSALDTLIRYNRADTQNLQEVATAVIDRLDRELFPADTVYGAGDEGASTVNSNQV